LIIVNPTSFFTVRYSVDILAILVTLALLPTLLAYSLFTLALSHIDASATTIIATLEPVAAILLAFLVLGESLDLPQIVGMMLVVLGIVVLHIRSFWVPIPKSERESAHNLRG
jgi:drug/metabolite transporter (DMT)-like permease